MPAPLLSVIQDMYNRDEYVLKDGDKLFVCIRLVGLIKVAPCLLCFFPFKLTIMTTLLRVYRIRGYHRNRGCARLTHVVCR